MSIFVQSNDYAEIEENEFAEFDFEDEADDIIQVELKGCSTLINPLIFLWIIMGQNIEELWLNKSETFTIFS